MGNVRAIITAHNRKILSEYYESKQPKTKKKKRQNDNCNCQKKNSCPLNGQCQTKNLIYKATVTTEKNEVKEYIGSTGNTFKTRFNQHKSSFRTKNKSTELAKYIADLEAGKTKFEIKWNILQKIKINSTTGVNGCTLCNLERLELARADRRKALNKRNELQSRCPHNKGNFF